MPVMQYREALRLALEEEMRRDPAVFIIGEDVGRYGGAYAVTRGLLERFGPRRVLDSPMSEALIVGAAVGAAMAGMRPVAEVMYVDFLTLAMDQLVNQAAKMRYMFGEAFRVPLVVRTQGGTGRGAGAQHSQSLESWFAHVPGLKVVAPATPADARGLLKSAIRDDNPVVFIEHKSLYAVKGEVPAEEVLVPIGQAAVSRPGSDLTIVTYSRMVHVALEAADDLASQGIDVEVIDLRSLRPWDEALVLESVAHTRRAVVLHEAPLTAGFGAEISARIYEALFDRLAAPVRRVAGAEVPIPANVHLERLVIPSAAQVVEAARTVVGRTMSRSA